MTSRLALALALVLAACGPRPGADAALQTAVPTAPPTVAVLGDGTGGGVLIVTFRAALGAPLSDTAPVRVLVGGRWLEAPLDAGPATSPEGDDVVVTQATYRLDAGAMGALAKVGADARLEVMMDARPTAYPLVRGDLLE